MCYEAARQAGNPPGVLETCLDIVRQQIEQARAAGQCTDQQAIPDSDGDGITDQYDSCPSQPEDFGSDPNDGCPDPSLPPKEFATPERAQGDVMIQKADGTLRPISADPLEKGDKIITGADGKIQLRLSGGSKLDIGPYTEFTLGKSGSIDLFKGKLKCIYHKGGDACSRVFTPMSVASVRGTEYAVTHDPTTDASTLHILEGSVELTATATGETRVFDAGTTIVVDSTGIREEKTLSMQEWDDLGKDIAIPDNSTNIFGTDILIIVIVAAAAVGGIVVFLFRKKSSTPTTSQKTKFCAGCGTALEQGTKFCRKCGRTITKAAT